MTRNRHCERIADYLLELSERGIQVPEETLFFAESTYGIEPADLGTTLAEGNFAEHELLLELMLFPDKSTRLGVERIIDGVALSVEQEDRIAGAVADGVESVRFCPAGQQPFLLQLERAAVLHMVAKLYLTRSIDAEICRCLGEHVPAETSLEAKLTLRCRGDQFSGDERSIVCRVIETGSQEGPHFQELFRTTLEILAGRQQSMSSEECLLAKRTELLEGLRGIREFEKKQEQYGMEYLLMQRYPVPTESVEVVSDRLRMVMLITDKLLKLRPASRSGRLQHNFGTFSSDQDLDQLIRILS